MLKFVRRAAFFCAATFAIAASAQTGIVTPSSVREYDPFVARVTFSQPYCLSDTSPIFGEISLQGTALNVVLTHVKSGPCVATRDVKLLGLPRGQYTLSISVSKPAEAGQLVCGSGGCSAIAETVQSNVTISPLSTLSTIVTYWTGRRVGSAGDAAGAVRLFGEPRGGFLSSSTWVWLEVGSPADTAYTFKAIGLPSLSNLPSAIVPLYFVEYPAPYEGTYVTPDLPTAERLSREWNSPFPGKDATTGVGVGKLVAGACPLGMSPVYQAFHPQSVAHRWTQSRVTYAMLLNVGYLGDGPAWCSPALRGE